MIAATILFLQTVLQQRRKAKPVSDVRMGMRAPPKYAWPISSGYSGQKGLMRLRASTLLLSAASRPRLGLSMVGCRPP